MKRGRSRESESCNPKDVPTIDATVLDKRMKEIYEDCSRLRQEYFESQAEGMWHYHGRERFLKTTVHDEIKRRADVYYQNLLMERVHYIPKEMVVIKDTSMTPDN